MSAVIITITIAARAITSFLLYKKLACVDNEGHI